MTFWTEARDTRGRNLWARGYSASWIAADLDTTRCAVIGRAHRTGWYRPDGTAITNAPANVAKVRKARQAPKAPPAPPPPPEGVLLEALTNTTCRWPMADQPPQRFCGAHTDCGPYCREHSRRAFQAGSGRHA